jgi:hypothetical protein
MLDSNLYDLTQNFQGTIYQAGMKLMDTPFPTPPPILQLRRGYAEAPAWLMVQALEFAPEPLTVANLRVRAVWSAPSIIQALLDLLASEKWLDRVGDEYHLRDQGREIIARSRDRLTNVVEPLLPLLDADEVERMESLLRRVIDASLNTPAPPGNWCLAHSRRRAPGEDAPALLKIIYYLSDINACRDDAHMAAFQPHGVDAYIWEALSFVWQGIAQTADELFDQLWYRGYSREDFAGALEELARRGWIQPLGDGRYEMTDQGRALREAAEQLTDEYFYAPWKACLSVEEIEELRGRMVAMCEWLGEMSQ